MIDKDKNKQLSDLIDQGHEVNQLNEYGNSLLHEAAETDDIYIAKLLIDSGADINIKALNESRSTPLHEAAFSGSCLVAKLQWQ